MKLRELDNLAVFLLWMPSAPEKVNGRGFLAGETKAGAVLVAGPAALAPVLRHAASPDLLWPLLALLIPLVSLWLTRRLLSSR